MRAGCFAYFVFLVSRDCCVALFRGAMDLSAVCDCGISWSYLLYSERNKATACILNKLFARVFEKEGDEELAEFMERNYSQPLESLIFTEEQDSKAIDHIKASKAQGPDSIHPKLI